MKPMLCCFHGPGCLDGFSAAWVVREAFGENDVEFRACEYNQPPPRHEEFRDRKVYIVDFSYNYKTLFEIGMAAEKLIVLDHHSGREKELDTLEGDFHAMGQKNVKIIYDQTRSGATLTWRHFFPMTTMPDLLKYVEDYDLHTKRYAETFAINAALASYPYDFAVWDKIFKHNWVMEGPGYGPYPLQIEGEAILRKTRADILDVIARTKRWMTIGGHHIPVCNAPYALRNAVCTELYLSHNVSFAAVYWDTPEGRKFSLRSSREGGVNVDELARSYNTGGGGHVHAAGLTMPTGWEGDAAC